jgi:hypothetical protein
MDTYESHIGVERSFNDRVRFPFCVRYLYGLLTSSVPWIYMDLIGNQREIRPFEKMSQIGNNPGDLKTFFSDFRAKLFQKNRQAIFSE